MVHTQATDRTPSVGAKRAQGWERVRVRQQREWAASARPVRQVSGRVRLAPRSS